MTFSRNRMITVIVALVALAALLYGAWYFFAPVNTYRGLTTTMEVEIDEATRTYLVQRLATTRAAVEAAKEKGEEVDLDLYLSIASDAFSLGDLVTAREALEVQLKENPAHYGAWNTYGTVLQFMGDYEGAKVAYQKAIALGAGASEEFYRDYIVLLEEHFPGSDDEIKAVLDLSVRDKGQTAWNMVSLGKWYVAHGECETGIDHYEVAVTLAPANTELKNELQEVRKTCK